MVRREGRHQPERTVQGEAVQHHRVRGGQECGHPQGHAQEPVPYQEEQVLQDPGQPNQQGTGQQAVVTT